MLNKFSWYGSHYFCGSKDQFYLDICNIYRSVSLHTVWNPELVYMIPGSSNQSWILLPNPSFLKPLWSLQVLIPRLWWCHFLLYLNTISLVGFKDSPWLRFILHINASQDSLVIKTRKPLEKFQARVVNITIFIVQ